MPSPTRTTNPYERIARELKAQKLCRLLRAMPGQFSPEELASAPDGFWLLLAQRAGVKPPSDGSVGVSIETRALVAEIMGEVQSEMRVA